MKMDWNLRRLGSGWRSFAITLFLLLITAAILAELTVDRISQLMTQKGYAEVDQRARILAKATYDRLTAADDRLRLIAALLGNKRLETSVPGEQAQPYFSAVTYVDNAGQRTELTGASQNPPMVDGAAIEQLLTGESLVIVTKDAGQEPKITLVIKSDPVTTASGFLTAEIDARHLWGGRNTYTELSSVCVLGGAYVFLSCPRPPPDSVLNRLISARAATSDGMLKWQDGAEKWLGGYANLSLRPRFPSADWTVLASQRQSAAFETFAAFGPVFAVFFIFSILLASSIIWTQIRRAAPAPADSISTRNGAESASAASSSIAERFERRGHAMAALSEIDRAILSHASLDRVIESTLKNATRVISADFVAVVLIDRDAPTGSQTILIRSGQPQERIVERASIDLATTRLLTSRPDGCWLDDSGDFAFLAPLAGRGAKRFLLLPVFLDGRISAIFTLGLIEGEALSSDEHTYARDIADRLGVALTASALNEELTLQGQLDSTTALPNRRAFKDRLSQEIARARREMRQLALLFIDLDEFKKINDSVG
ncbi:MAG: diguanylate cyclase domain-containing protein, partial [Burkholderiales bacterium]